MQKKLHSKAVKSSLIFFIVASLIALPIRIYEYFKIIEPVSGFYSVVDASVYILNVALVLLCAVFILLFVLSKKDIAYRAEGKKNKIVAAAAFILSFALIIASLSIFKDAVISISNPNIAIYNSLFDNLFRTGAGAKLLEGIAASVSCVYFILFGIDFLKGSTLAQNNKVLALFPVLWCIFRLMHRFMKPINFLNVSDLLYEMIMVIFLMLFFMSLASLHSKVNSDGQAYKLGAFGMPAALFCLLCFIPRVIALIANKAYLIPMDSPIEWCDIACAFFIISIVAATIFDKSEIAETESDDEENKSIETEFSQDNGDDSENV